MIIKEYAQSKGPSSEGLSLSFMCVWVMIPTATDAGIDDEQYPLTTGEFLERYGDVELELQNGTEQIGDALGRMDDEVFDSALEARFAVYAGVSHRAVGRRFYSDRDPTPPGAPHGPEQISF